jgi:hypothetical protein
MRTSRLAIAAPLLALALVAPARDAQACGGCFAPPTENTQVASHRMVLSVSKTQSTLYDQFQYSGNPTEFAWVLPVKGTVTVGLSSDALFNELDQMTAVIVSGPAPCFCNVSATGTTAASGSTGSGVTVVAQQVVGPYETVQLSATDPNALNTWLTSHGYAIPTDIQPTIAAYVADKFDFLALKLVPGQGIDAMKPVRVTTPGGNPVLPLRMVAAGVGAKVPITLFVVAEGRYEPTNYPWFTISEDALVWNYGSNTSNYKTLRQQGFDMSMNRGWQIESASPMDRYAISDPLLALAASDPMSSGYADDMGNGAPAAAQDDMDALFSGISPNALWVTRMLAELPRAALDSDLTLGASAKQTIVPRYLSAKGVPCDCSTGPTGSTAGVGGAGGAGGAGGGGGGQDSGCSVNGGSTSSLAPLGALVALALVAARRSRKR